MVANFLETIDFSASVHQNQSFLSEKIKITFRISLHDAYVIFYTNFFIKKFHSFKRRRTIRKLYIKSFLQEQFFIKYLLFYG